MRRVPDERTPNMSIFKRDADGTMPSWVYTTIALGVAFFGIALLCGIIRPDTDRFTSEADGIVSRVEVKRKSGKANRYITYVRFTDSDNRTYTAMSVVNGSWHRHDEGDQVRVRFDARDPEAGCLIVGDEDKLGAFNTFVLLCRYGGGAVLVVGVVSAIIIKVRG